jgi:ABC-type branched-subunit amino acid transport system permease subunit
VPVDLGRVMLVGCGVWLVALAVCAVAALVGTWSWMPAWVCVAGLAAGAFGWDWARRHRPAGPPRP